ncbi:MAG: CPBP family intramembrane metalloprotease [Austwickia sp.]|nr:CPBP family intramembrane metalloprotease [Austwickia sp.]
MTQHVISRGGMVVDGHALEPCRQYSARTVLGLWAAVTLPMAVLAFVVGPLLAPHVDLHRGLLHWILMVVAMMWQSVLSLLLLRREGPLTWARVRRRIRLNGPLDPATGRDRRRLWWWVLPAIAANVMLGLAAEPLVSLWSRVTGLEEPAWANMSSLARPEFVGQWWIVGLALVSAAFNYVLGEELFFRGVLLPRMEQAFGRWDWVMNTIMFGLYHVHKIWFWPAMIVSSFGISWAARRYRSLGMAIVVHGVEGLVVIGLVLAVVAGWWLP